MPISADARLVPTGPPLGFQSGAGGVVRVCVGWPFAAHLEEEFPDALTAAWWLFTQGHAELFLGAYDDEEGEA